VKGIMHIPIYSQCFLLILQIYENFKFMKKILAYPLSIIFYLIFILLLLIFHPIQVIGYNLIGYRAQKKAVDILNFFLVHNMLVLFCRPTFHGFEKLPLNRPLIIVANHQSMFDISPVVWGFRKHHAKFISKKELGKNLPSISYNLRKGGSVLIDRENGTQAIKEIYRLGSLLEQKNYSACLYPEGTRSKTGEVKRFRLGGFKTLLNAAPSALIVPFVIDGNYKLNKYGKFPLNIGLRLKYTVLEPIEREDHSEEVLLQKVENNIKMALGQA
jgi:1-acyl-sn-glycerol-3-phosphate acyltransferase